MNKLLQAFIEDIQIESVKFQMQAGVEQGELQHNDIIGTFDFKTLNGRIVAGILGKQLKKVKDLLGAHDPIQQLVLIVNEWNKTRIEIQYSGYGYGEDIRSEAYCYVLLLRILKQHRKLYLIVLRRQDKKMHKLIKNRLT